MQLSYKARYYNGHSTKPFTVDFSFTETGIHIQYEDETHTTRSETWLKADIHETDFSSSIVTLRYGTTFPYQQLEITDQQALAEYREHYSRGTLKHWIHHRTGRVLALAIGGFVVSILLSYFYLLPFAADQIAQRFPKDLEISLGDEMYQSLLGQSAIDTAKTEAINHFFQQLDIPTDYPIHITVVKDSIVNAFAVPGGGIVVYDAILKDLNEPEALAALLAHEYSHVELKHATRNLFRSIAGYAFISILFSDVNGVAAVVLQNAHTLRTLKYSRELEQEADANGLEILKNNHLSSKGMVHLFERLKKEDHLQVNELLSTHPELDARIDFAKTFARQHSYSIKANDSLQFYFNRLKTDTAW